MKLNLIVNNIILIDHKKNISALFFLLIKTYKVLIPLFSTYFLFSYSQFALLDIILHSSTDQLFENSTHKNVT